MERYMGNETRANNTYHLQPLKRIHLYTHVDYDGELGPDQLTDYADIQNVYLFSGIAFLILLIACVNFMNLATARSTNRAREVGLRKVSGAYRFQLIRQFFGRGDFVVVSGICIGSGVGRVDIAKIQCLCRQRPRTTKAYCSPHSGAGTRGFYWAFSRVLSCVFLVSI